MDKVSVIICVINNQDVLRLCLQNLEKIKNNSYQNLEVVVGDNNSYDGTPEMVEKEFPWVKLLRLENYGLAYNLNRCLKIATGDYYLYLGADGFPEMNTIPYMVEYARKHPDVGAITAKLLLRDGRMDMDCHRGLQTPWSTATHFLKLDKLFPKSKIFAQYFLSYKGFDTEHEIDSCITHFMFVTKKAQDMVGNWDEENFFLFGEDIDFCYRLKLAGFKLMYLPQVTAGHWKGTITGLRKETKDVAAKHPDYFSFRGKKLTVGEFRLQMKRCSTEAMAVFYKKHLEKKYPLLLNCLVYTMIRALEIIRIFQQRIINKRNGVK